MKIKNKWNILPKLEKHQFIGTKKKNKLMGIKKWKVLTHRQKTYLGKKKKWLEI